jgi:EAL domain-containing protein (putative c-di-GMP-specific phosphodiesterase class I)
MSKYRVLSFKPQLRLEWRGQDGQNETEQPDHSASLGDSNTSSTRIRFSVHTTILGLGQLLKVPGLAEGVEADAQLAWFAAEGCNEVLGYLIGDRSRLFVADEFATKLMPLVQAIENAGALTLKANCLRSQRSGCPTASRQVAPVVR